MMQSLFQSIVKPTTSFWNWWSNEIIDMIPIRLKDASTSRNYLDIYADTGSTIIESVIAGKGNRLIENAAIFDLDEDCWTEITSLTQELSPRLFLSSNDVLIIDVVLPNKAVTDPEAALALQLPIYSPLDIDKVEWSYFRVGSYNNHINFKLVLVKSSKLDAIEMLFAQHDVMPPAIAAKLDGNILFFRKPLIMKTSLPENRRMQFRLASLFLLFSIPISTIWAAHILTTNNQEKSGVMETQVATKLASWRDEQGQEKIRHRLVPLSGRKSILPIMEEVATLLPDTMWIQSAYTENIISIILEVNAPSDTQIIKILELSQNIKTVKLVETKAINPKRSIHTVELLHK